MTFSGPIRLVYILLTFACGRMDLAKGVRKEFRRCYW